jgi:DNA-binding LytR/AlgR family response regulator
MTINCIAIDDEPLALKQMESYIDKTPFLNLVASCSSAFEALKVLESHEVALMFVDINMPDLSGLDFVKSLDQKPAVIFTTAYSEYAIDGFKVDALDYLLKPIGYQDFLKAANKAAKILKQEHSSGDTMQSNDQYLFIKSAHKIIRLNYADVKYIEGMREYVRIHLSNEKPIMTLISMKKMEESLPEDSFMRVHRSFIVNLKKITTIERNRIIFDEKVYIPVSDQYKAKFQEYINKNFLL